jgi:N-acyl-D-amino-acid deacylase
MSSSDTYDNLLHSAGTPDNVLLVGFKSDKLKPLTGKTLGEVARIRHATPEDTAMDLVIEDDSRVDTVYFLMSEDNIRKQIVLPWVSFGADADPEGIDGVFLKFSAHPRTFGNFARVYAHYVRDEKLMTVTEAVRKMTSLPASNLGIANRGLLRQGYFADIVVFDPATIRDQTPPAGHRYFRGLRQRRAGGSQRRAHRRKAGPRRQARPDLTGQVTRIPICGYYLFLL